MLSRRKFFGSSALAAAAFGFPHVGASAQQLHIRTRQRPRHIIHLVADGMSVGTLTCADHFSRILRGRGSTWMDLYSRPEARGGWMNMRSLNSLVTDSAAASSSWGCGTRVMNGRLNQMRDGRDLTPLYTLYGDNGWRCGLVTTAEITHATPAGFAANTNDRGKAEIIAAQYLQRKIDILLGGGRKFFDPKVRADKRDLLAEYQCAGYTVMTKRQELEDAATDRRWLGVFDGSHLPFTLDHRLDTKKRDLVPTLAAMTARALEWLGRSSHFILQVEGARVDHAAHNSDAAAAFYDQIAFDEAIDVCLDFQKNVPDTLLVITTDHGNSNLGLNGMGDSYTQSPTLFRNLLQARRSFPEILSLVRKSETVKIGDYLSKDEKARALNPEAHPDKPPVIKAGDKKDKEVVFVKPIKEIIEIVYESTGYKLSERRAARLAPFLAKKGAPLYEGLNSETAALGQIMANHVGVGFTGSAHTSDFVPILAIGPGSEHFQGFVENTDVFYRYLSFGKVDFRNPREPEIVESLPAAGSVEDIRQYALV
ncbi:MAG: alkaline phosphatase [Verrucomicrobiia bacterium]